MFIVWVIHVFNWVISNFHEEKIMLFFVWSHTSGAYFDGLVKKTHPDLTPLLMLLSYVSFPFSHWNIGISLLITVTSFWARWRLTSVYSTVYSGADQRKHQSSALLAFVRRIHRRPVNSPHKGPVMEKMFPFDDVIMLPFLFRSLVGLIGRPGPPRIGPPSDASSMTSSMTKWRQWHVPASTVESSVCRVRKRTWHYYDVIMSAMASEITSLTMVYSTVYSGADQRKSKLRVTGLLWR